MAFTVKEATEIANGIDETACGEITLPEIETVENESQDINNEETI